jgi:hypothetical protein
MSDEIVDIESQSGDNIPEETISQDGMNIPDNSMVESINSIDETEIASRRKEVQSLPEYPKEWQQGYSEENQQGFESDVKMPITATIKQNEINKLIKKYKRYMKSNIREINRISNTNE